MNKYSSPWLRGAALALLFGICIPTHTQEEASSPVTDNEIALMSEFPDTQFAYIPENVREIIVALKEELKEHCCSQELLADLEDGANIALYADMVSAMPAIMQTLDSTTTATKEAYATYKTALSIYEQALNDGQALINLEPETRSNKSKTLGSLVVKCKLITSKLKVCGNAQILGNLTVGGTTLVAGTGGLNINGSTTINTLIVSGNTTLGGPVTFSNPTTSTLTASGTPSFSSLIPFSSGLVTVSITPATLGAPSVMAFGNSFINGPDIAVNSPLQTGYAFSVPRDGWLHNLQANADLLYTINNITPAPQQNITFTLLRSPANFGCQHAVPNAYTALLSTTVCFSAFPSPLGFLTPASSSSQNAGSVAVSAGDRIVLQVSADPAPININFIFALALSAGVFYTPA